MADEKTQNISEYCLKCKNSVPQKFQDGQITLEQARKLCAYCKFGKVGIYKFDIVYALFQTSGKRPTGKKATYTKRYGTAVEQLHIEGKSTRQIAKILGISPTSVTKILKELGVTD